MVGNSHVWLLSVVDITANIRGMVSGEYLRPKALAPGRS